MYNRLHTIWHVNLNCRFIPYSNYLTRNFGGWWQWTDYSNRSCGVIILYQWKKSWLLVFIIFSYYKKAITNYFGAPTCVYEGYIWITKCAQTMNLFINIISNSCLALISLYRTNKIVCSYHFFILKYESKT